jgi:hypothetical protein
MYHSESNFQSDARKKATFFVALVLHFDGLVDEEISEILSLLKSLGEMRTISQMRVLLHYLKPCLWSKAAMSPRDLAD